jgi:hypothetical protein
MTYPKFIFAVLITSLLLTACSPTKAPVKYLMGQSTSTGCSTPEVDKIATCKVNGTTDPTIVPTQAVGPQLDLSKSDGQGAVTVKVILLNLDELGDALVFDVSMNTHSVDLSMDLAQLTVLTTDTGKTIQPLKWDGQKGGHHVEGKLSFSTTLDGKDLFDGTRTITITIKDVDAPARIFTWQLTG